MQRIRIVLCLATLLVPAGARAQTGSAAPTARFAALRDTVRTILAAQRVPSIAVAVAQGSRVLWEEGFGFADVGRTIPATQHTIYSLASISKPFTATALMVQVERGAVQLDKPANEYLGSAKLRAYDGDAAQMTVRRVASHSAGLPLHYQFFYDGVMQGHSDDVAITEYGFAGYPPGAAYFYSNLGYGVIGYIAARARSTTYETVMRTDVFEPLGLTNTTVSTGRDLGARAALRYDNTRTPIAPYAFDHAGGSAVWSSAHDLVRFGMFHLGATVPGQRQILTRDSRAEMQRPYAPATGPGASYGLGWATLEDDNGYRRVSHTGGMPGVSTVLNLFPSDSLVIVVLANQSTPAVGRIANAIAATMLPRYAATRDARRAAAAGAGPVTPASFSPGAELSGRWRGVIRVGADSVPVQLDVRADGDVHVQFGTELPTVLTAANYTNGWFSGRFQAQLRAPDATPAAERHRVAVALSLRARDERLTGWASAVTQGPVAYGAVSYRAEFSRR